MRQFDESVHDLAGAEIYVERNGRTGPSLVLVHGGFGSSTEWASMLPLLDGLQVITPDSRGHGRSTNPTGVLSYPLLADDLAELIRTLRLDRPVVGGWSDGGQVVLELAVRHPDVAGPLIVGGAYPDFVGSGLRETHRALLGADADGRPDLDHLDRLLGDVGAELRALHQLGDDHWATLIHQTASMWLDYAGLSGDQLATITHPALVLAGDRDELIPLDLSIALYRALPLAELAITPFAGHGGPMSSDRVAAFAGVIRDFVHRHPGGGHRAER